jgi:DNA-binding PadR family transcriptional regulator
LHYYASHTHPTWKAAPDAHRQGSGRGRPRLPLVLAILSEGESYGYALLKRVRDVSRGELEWTDGMLYPLLHRLQRLGYVTTDWRVPPEGRRRRYYVITDEGRAALAEQQRQWVTVTRALGDALRNSGPGPAR